jgi:hypothetical protein
VPRDGLLIQEPWIFTGRHITIEIHGVRHD